MSKSPTFRQCTLRRHDRMGVVLTRVESVPSAAAKLGHPQLINGERWTITHVGAKSDSPRAAHESKV